MAKYKELIVFQKAYEFAFKIYKASESFPKSEMFGLTSDLSRDLKFIFLFATKAQLPFYALYARNPYFCQYTITPFF